MADDPRLDPRQRPLLKMMEGRGSSSAMVISKESEKDNTWEEIYARANTPARQKQMQATFKMMEGLGDTNSVPVSTLDVQEGTFISNPDNNHVPFVFFRPKKYNQMDKVPCVYYLHGGGMSSLSVFYSFYQVWLRRIANQNVAVFAIDFRNSLTPSKNPIVAPFPAGLNDCVAGIQWLHENAGKFGIDSERIIIAGESGGGNLTIATTLKLKQLNKLHIISGFYPLCPYIAGEYPQKEQFPSHEENNGILLTLGGGSKYIYGIDGFNNKDPLAWPSFATIEDCKGLPPVIVVVNECDPLRDEGIDFYRKCMRAGVNAQCRIVVGTMHGGELLGSMPEVSDETARSIAFFAFGNDAKFDFIFSKNSQ